ncbi:MAG: GH3 auxin-responsive promoter family protein [Bacteroidetes bacterium]|nr:GH3 auxin-responsive promoter family protein [Bacteroidota bacterium]
MNVKSLLAKPFAGVIHRQIQKERKTALADQQTILNQLVKQGKATIFGKDHQFELIKDYASFKQQVPLRDYEEFKPYIELIKQGGQNVLWKGRPIYFAKTSGTTSGVKYIPITKDSISNHINGARNALLVYMSLTGSTQFAGGKMIFLSGSPELERVGGIPTGRLSGIVNHHIPQYLRGNQLPSYETNCIEEWEEKLDKIVAETSTKDMTLIGGIPPWIQMYFDRLIEKTGKPIKELFPNLQVMVQGGVNFEPYKFKLLETLGQQIDTIELFPASEGFFAYQDTRDLPGLLLNTNSGIFYEFVPLAQVHQANPTRLSLAEVELGEQYALIINSNAGLWGYSIGDTVKFVSIDPYRIIVTGRIKHFISAFGEHVIGEEVEQSLLKVCTEMNVSVIEFTVAPMIQQGQGKSYHEWFIEFEKAPSDMALFSQQLNAYMCEKNVYYQDLIIGNILEPLHVQCLQKNAFIQYMSAQGKLGGQNKAPRLSNDRIMATALLQYISN